LSGQDEQGKRKKSVYGWCCGKALWEADGVRPWPIASLRKLKVPVGDRKRRYCAPRTHRTL
jgi:hypothetical protein